MAELKDELHAKSEALSRTLDVARQVGLPLNDDGHYIPTVVGYLFV